MEEQYYLHLSGELTLDPEGAVGGVVKVTEIAAAGSRSELRTGLVGALPAGKRMELESQFQSNQRAAAYALSVAQLPHASLLPAPPPDVV